MPQHSITSSAASIYETLKNSIPSVTLYRDGIGVDGMGSMRLSNSSAFQIALLLANATLTKTAEITSHYFASPNQVTNYKVETADEFVKTSPVEAGDCGTIGVSHGVPYGYDEIKNWPSGWHGSSHSDFKVRLLRGAGEFANDAIESCITQLIQKQLDNESSEGLKKAGMVIAAMAGLCVIGGIIYAIDKAVKNNNCSLPCNKKVKSVGKSYSNYKSISFMPPPASTNHRGESDLDIEKGTGQTLSPK